MDKQRHQSYKRVQEALEHEQSLRPREKEILLDSAEGLFLDDVEGEDLLRRAQEQLALLVTSDRWMPDTAEDFLQLLESCGSSESADEPV